MRPCSCGLRAFSHSSIPVWWCRDVPGVQPPDEHCLGYPPIAAFTVVYTGEDYAVFGIDITTVKPDEWIFAPGICCTQQAQETPVAFAVSEARAGENVAGVFVEQEQEPSIIVGESIEPAVNWEAAGIISVLVVHPVAREAIEGFGVFDDRCRRGD